jgi:hypothetical protein
MVRITTAALVLAIAVAQSPRAVKGRYRHPGLGFSVLVPEKATGLLEDDPAVERGIRIALPSGGSIFAYGELNSLEWCSATDGIRAAVANYPDCTASEIQTSAGLGNLAGAQVRLLCGEQIILIALAFRPDGGPIYWLRLETASTHETADVTFFRKVASSFQIMRWQ